MAEPARPAVMSRDPVFHDLGLILVEVNGVTTRCGGTVPSLVLSLLLAHVNRRVSVETMVDAVWGTEVTTARRASLESHIWRLRRLIEPGRGRREPSRVLVNEGGGYRLVVRPHQVDSLRFMSAGDRVASLLTGDRADESVRAADEALALWRGRPFTPCEDHALLRDTVARLELVRSRLRLRLARALLASGRVGRAEVELHQLLAETPAGSRSHELLDLSAAIGATDLGISPDADTRDVGVASPPLPASRSRLIGRDVEVSGLRALVPTVSLVTLVGPAGSGKTRLATEIGTLLRSRFEDGVWFVDLTAADDATGVWAAIARSLGVSAPAEGSVERAVATHCRSRRMLLILDNCEHVLEAVATTVGELLASGSTLAVLVTSREPVDVTGEHRWQVNPLAVPDLSAPETELSGNPAVQLFCERLAAVAPDMVVDGARLRMIAEICARLDGIPLAIELAAARLHAYTLGEVADQVRTDPTALGQVGRPRSRHHRTLRAAIEWSHRLLSAEEQVVHRRVSVVHGPFTSALATALAPDLSAGVGVENLLGLLSHRSLLVPLGPLSPGVPSRFAQLDTVRADGARRLAESGEAERTAAARDDWVLRLVRSRPRIGHADEVAWFEAVDADLHALWSTLQRSLVDDPSPIGVALTGRLDYYWHYRGLFNESRHWTELALQIRDTDALDALQLRTTRAVGDLFQGRLDLARPHLDRVLSLVDAAAVGPGLPEVVDALIGLASALWVVGDQPTLRAVAGHLHALARRYGDETAELFAETTDLVARWAPEAEPVSLPEAEDLYRRIRRHGNHFAAWLVARKGMRVSLGADRTWVQRTHTTTVRLGVTENATLLQLRGNLLLAAGDASGALQLFSAAREKTVQAELQWPSQPETADSLGRAWTAVGERAAQEEWELGRRLSAAQLHERSRVLRWDRQRAAV